MPNGNGKMVSNGVKSQECNNKRQARAQLKRIKWDLRFRGANQKRFYEAIENNDVTISVGPAGCGKTFLATHYALKMFAQKAYKNIDCVFVFENTVAVGFGAPTCGVWLPLLYPNEYFLEILLQTTLLRQQKAKMEPKKEPASRFWDPSDSPKPPFGDHLGPMLKDFWSFKT